jgi:hypothetical protein
MSYSLCVRCGCAGSTAFVTFRQNVSYFFRRRQREFSGRVCLGCMTSEFLHAEFVTMIGTWWGIIGAILGPFFLLANLFDYLAGTFEILRDKLRSSSSPRPRPEASTSNLLKTLGQLMEEYPTALMDTSRLPASKQLMKEAIKEGWRVEPNLRASLGRAYLFLSNFQDGIGDAVLDCVIPNSAPSGDLEALRREVAEMSGPNGESFRQWIMWSKVSVAEMEILAHEWGKFERGASAT